MKFLFINIRKNFVSLLFFLFTVCLIIFSKSNIASVKNSLNIWVNNIIPSLLPFFIATELINKTNIPDLIGSTLNKIMRPFFNVPGIGAYALFMGIISGYPVGAKIITDFRNNNLCSKEEAERLITFTNNSGPLFILGTVGITLYYDTTIGILLLLTHILASLTVGFIFKFWKYNTRNNYESTYNQKQILFSSLGEVISKSINSAIASIILIGGFIILFGLIISILQKLNLFKIIFYIFTPIFNILKIKTDYIIPFFTGLIEVSNGVTNISLIQNESLLTNIIISSFLLGFGGISVTLQVLAIISKTDISFKPYLIGKLLHGIISAFYTFILIKNISFLGYLS